MDNFTPTVKFAVMSLGGFNAGKKGASCKTASELLEAWLCFSKTKGREYSFTTGEWQQLLRQAEGIIKRRKRGPVNGVDSKYWQIVRSQDEHIRQIRMDE